MLRVLSLQLFASMNSHSAVPLLYLFSLALIHILFHEELERVEAAAYAKLEDAGEEEEFSFQGLGFRVIGLGLGSNGISGLCTRRLPGIPARSARQSQRRTSLLGRAILVYRYPQGLGLRYRAFRIRSGKAFR